MSDNQLSYPRREEEILAHWEKNNIFQKTVKKDAPKGNFVFFEGPPTANGKPAIHHAEARAFKDCIPRFKTMQGYRVERKAGWDTHGLPVELEVEKQLGFKSKTEIEEFGIDKFNKKCRESVWTYLKSWHKFTRRLGYWVDLENAYATYNSEYVESLWWVIRQFWDKGLLYKDYRITPHCPRCGTSLSSHELSQGYKDVKDLTVTARFVISEASHDALKSDVKTSILAWTTTPWTLPGNVGLAVGKNIDYVVVELTDDEVERVIVAKARLEDVFTNKEYKVIAELKGADLVGVKYEPLYNFISEVIADSEKEKLEQKAYQVYAADFVTTEDGTGVVHTAVMYGHDDFILGNEVGLPKQHLVKLDGTFIPEAGFLANRFVRDEDVAVDIIKDLAHRGLLFSKAKYEHSYPHCWRCKTPVIYYAKDSWYVRMSSLRDQLLAENEKVNWEPSHIKDGRFGEWLREVKDWAFSRERYWGTPLPIWECQSCDGRQCIGSYQELREKSLSDLPEEIDPHRPYSDEMDLKCDKCGGTAKRVPDVVDVWFDSGCMPFAQWHYPFENKEKVDAGESFPADYISEAIDQTRGWFYTLLAVSTALGLPAPYKNVVCLGLILDANGKKMAKSIGNVVEPMELMDRYGADAIRWYMYSINQPGESKRFDEKILVEMIRKNFNLFTNVVSFYEMYTGDAGSWKIKAEESTNILDKWVLARMNSVVKDVTVGLEKYKITESVRNIEDWINELSTWYVRRSRKRLKGTDEEDKIAALATLRECILTTAKLMAPFAPFIAEDVYIRMHGELESVHLDVWPVVDESLIDETVLSNMQLARQVVTKALEQRAETKMSVRQPLASMVVTVPTGELSEEYQEVIKDEVNIKLISIEKGELAVTLDTELTPELRREGLARDIIRKTNSLRKKAELTIDDRIELYVEATNEQVAKTLEEHRQTILAGTLASDLRASGDRPELIDEFNVQEIEIVIGIKKQD